MKFINCSLHIQRNIKSRFANDFQITFQEHKRRIVELEARQRVLECSFRGLRQLRQELVSLNRECEKNENNIHGFLSSFLPEYRDCYQSKESLDKNNNEPDIEEIKKEGAKRNQHFQNRIRQTPTDKTLTDKIGKDVDDFNDDVGEQLPIPTVSYDWCGSPTFGSSSSRLPSYLPKSGENLRNQNL
jgi:hypothetical protein